jgi:hypothetical protein
MSPCWRGSGGGQGDTHSGVVASLPTVALAGVWDGSDVDPAVEPDGWRCERPEEDMRARRCGLPIWMEKGGKGTPGSEKWEGYALPSS